MMDIQMQRSSQCQDYVMCEQADVKTRLCCAFLGKVVALVSIDLQEFHPQSNIGRENWCKVSFLLTKRVSKEMNRERM